MVLVDLGVAPSLDLTPSSMVVFVEMHSNPKLMLRAEKCIQRRMGDGWRLGVVKRSANATWRWCS